MTVPSRRSPLLAAGCALIRALGYALPRSERGTWRKEWLAELEGEWLVRLQRGQLTPLRKLILARQTLGAGVDVVHFWIETMVMMAMDLPTLFRAPRRDLRTTAVVVVTLALGIGATTALFSVIHGVLLRPLDYPEVDRLVMVWDQPDDAPEQRLTVNPRNWTDWGELNTSFDDIAAFNLWALTIPADDGYQRIPGVVASANYLGVLGVAPILGRLFTPDDDRPGAERVVVISYELWQRQFGGDSSVVGKTIATIAGGGVTVIGVMPPGFSDLGRYFFQRPDVWAPFQSDFLREGRSSHWLRTVARLKPGISVAAADADLRAIATRLATAYPESNEGWTTAVIPLHEQIVGDVRPALLVLSAAVGLVLLIACANVANLLLARSANRGREFAVRAALGAGRSRIVAQLLGESLVFAGLGGALGVGLAYFGAAALVRLAPDLPRADAVGVTPAVLGFALLITTATGILFGLAPAFRAGSVDLLSALKAGGRGTDRSDGRRFRAGLIIGEVAVTVVLLVGAGLFTRSFAHLRGIQPGFDATNVLTARLNLPSILGEERAEVVADVIRGIGGLPGVEHVGAVSTLPIDGLNNIGLAWFIAGTAEPREEKVEAGYREATPDYFAAMRIELLSGRLFTEADRTGSTPVAVVNDEFVRQYLDGEHPIGKRVVSSFGGDIDAEIVGVVRGVQYENLATPAGPEVYLPHRQQHPLAISFLALRTDGAPLGITDAVRRVVRERDAAIVAEDFVTMEQIVSASVARPRFNMLLTNLFSMTALVLAAVGLYAVLAHSVSRRVNEIGIRMALGAHRADVVGMVMRDGMTLVVVGCALGLGVALASTHVLQSLLFEVATTDPVSFVGAPGLVLLVALAATYVPARVAAHCDPNDALRRE